jgi:hypothetical protein
VALGQPSKMTKSGAEASNSEIILQVDPEL